MDDNFIELKRFFDSENVKWTMDSRYTDTLYFRAYGQTYSVIYLSGAYDFCCKPYKTINALIDAINKKCRGRDGKF